MTGTTEEYKETGIQIIKIESRQRVQIGIQSYVGGFRRQKERCNRCKAIRGLGKEKGSK